MNKVLLTMAAFCILADAAAQKTTNDLKIRINADQFDATTYALKPFAVSPTVDGLRVATDSQVVVDGVTEYRWTVTNQSTTPMTRVKIATLIDLEFNEETNTFFNETASLSSLTLPNDLSIPTGMKAIVASSWAVGEMGYTATGDLNKQFNTFTLSNRIDNQGDDIAVAFMHNVGTIKPGASIQIALFEGDIETLNGVTHSDEEANLQTVINSVLFRPVSLQNTAPTAIADRYELLQGSSINLEPLNNDSDDDSDTLIIITLIQTLEGGLEKTYVINNEQQVINLDGGQLTILADASLSFSADSDFTGNTTIDYVISDGQGGTDRETITIMVTEPANNVPPEMTPDYYNLSKGQSIPIDPLANDKDADNDTLTITHIDGVALTGMAQAIEVTGGKLIIADDQSIMFVANAALSTRAQIRYTITDGNGHTVESIIFLNIAGVLLKESFE